jgi:hypothetical protein
MARTSEIGSHKTTVKSDLSKSNLLVTYHNTDVVTVNNGFITLRHGGFKTNTTKLRMNQASRQYNLSYVVYQSNFSWFVDYKGKTYEFIGDSLTLQV